jgi:hypothetical protein
LRGSGFGGINAREIAGLNCLAQFAYRSAAASRSICGQWTDRRDFRAASAYIVILGVTEMKSLNKNKSIVIAATTVILLTIALSMSAYAGDLSKTYSGQFTTAWELTAASDYANLTYGFNTDWINEDYAWANNSNASHNASLTNGTGVHPGPAKAAGTVSRIEVTHNGSTVEYHCYW